MKSKRKGYVRRRISNTETAISCMLLLLLAGIGLAIYAKGQIYDPSLFRTDLSLFSKRRPTEARSDQPVPDGGYTPSPGGEVRQPSPSGLLDGLAPTGWKPLEKVTQFAADTLW